MKYLLFLLMSTILFLAVKPGIELISSQISIAEENCCIGQCCSIIDLELEEEAPEKPKGHCDGSNCNPFQSCSSFSLLCMNIPVNSIENLAISTKQLFSYRFSFTSQFPPDFWQPPKLV